MKGKTAYVVADLEGSTGAWTKAHTLLGTPEWQQARVELTRDINAAAKALFDIGARGVVVKDFHRTGFNLIPKFLDRRIRLVSGYYSGPALGYGNLHGADIALFIGLHASGGNERGFLPHTLTSRIAEIRVNGRRVCEAQLFATVLSDFDVPVSFFSGCPEACAEVRERMGWVVCCSVDKPPEIYADETRRRSYLLNQRQKLKETIRKLRDSAHLPLFAMKGPFECEVLFPGASEARRHNRWGFSESGAVLSFRAAEFLELYRNLLKIAYFNRPVYALRSILLPLSRLVWKIQSLKHLPDSP